MTPTRSATADQRALVVADQRSGGLATTAATAEAPRIMRDFLVIFERALLAGDRVRAAQAAATIQQQTHLALIDLDPESMICPEMTHENGTYVPPKELS